MNTEEKQQFKLSPRDEREVKARVLLKMAAEKLQSYLDDFNDEQGYYFEKGQKPKDKLAEEIKTFLENS
jgi:hypothetical protein